LFFVRKEIKMSHRSNSQKKDSLFPWRSESDRKRRQQRCKDIMEDIERIEKLPEKECKEELEARLKSLNERRERERQEAE
jgi:hypothetical protein